MRILISIIFLSFAQLLYGQKTNIDWFKKLDHLQLQPIVAFQFWSTYTHDMEVYKSSARSYNSVDNRLNTQLHRSRFGFKGAIYPNLKFNLTTSLDFVGRDVLSATQGGNNNGASPSFRLWAAYLQWKIKKQSDAFHFTLGYIIPQIGRESITSAFRVTSMEKSWSQNYLRRHLMGTGPGRVMGFNLGGQTLNKQKQLGLRYDFGIFNPTPQAFSGNSTGEKFAPLIVGRIVFQFGDPESDSYSLGHKVNYFGERNGVSIALVSAYQKTTDGFEQQQAIGADWLINWHQINIDGEYTWLTREGYIDSDPSTTLADTYFSTAYIRLSYNITLANGKVIEPAGMITRFAGPMNEEDQFIADRLGTFAGEDYSYDIGINYYFNPDLKLSLHYVWNEGDLGSAEVGETINNFFSQPGVGAIRRGNWLGLGFVVIL